MSIATTPAADVSATPETKTSYVKTLASIAGGLTLVAVVGFGIRYFMSKATS